MAKMAALPLQCLKYAATSLPLNAGVELPLLAIDVAMLRDGWYAFRGSVAAAAGTTVGSIARC